jgi:hypothetical protein
MARGQSSSRVLPCQPEARFSALRFRAAAAFFAGRIDLLALILVGRGDFDIAEWPDAVREARGLIAGGNPDFMIGDAALPEYLGAGLDSVEKTHV